MLCLFYMVGECMKRLLIALGTCLVGMTAIVASMFLSAKRVSVKQHTMKAKAQLHDAELTVFFISDIHRRHVPKKLLDKVQSMNQTVDLVILGGDIAEKGVSAERVRKNVHLLSRLGPIYYIWGNNDREIGEQTIRDILSEVDGITVGLSRATTRAIAEFVLDPSLSPAQCTAWIENVDVEQLELPAFDAREIVAQRQLFSERRWRAG